MARGTNREPSEITLMARLISDPLPRLGPDHGAAQLMRIASTLRWGSSAQGVCVFSERVYRGSGPDKKKQIDKSERMSLIKQRNRSANTDQLSALYFRVFRNQPLNRAGYSCENDSKMLNYRRLSCIIDAT